MPDVLLRFWPFGISALILAADRLTKFWIEGRVQFWETITVIPGFFQIVHTRNRGIAFGIFNEDNGRIGAWLLVIFSAAVLSFIATLLWRNSASLGTEHWTLRLGLGLVLGGALGNLYDRIAFGSVTDFLDFYWGMQHFPVFNIADSAITAGAGLLLIHLWQTRNEPATAA